MIDGLLLDSHAMVWLEAGALLRAEALDEIDLASANKRLFVSHITIWELGVALGKKRIERRPDLGGLAADRWFMETSKRLELRALSISARVAMESANVPAVYGYGDPGDCFLIATARVRRLGLVTRDAKMLELAARRPEYLTVIAC